MDGPVEPAGDLRADAERNRQRIVRAAHEAFAAEGIDVSMAEIARRAHVGFATAQRRFPTKQALIEEVLRAQLTDLASASEDAEGQIDPWQAFVGVIESCCAHQAREPGLAGPLAQIISTLAGSPNEESIARAFEGLAARAKANGALRADIEFTDLLLVLKANAGVITSSPGHEVEASQRFMRTALRGLQADPE